MMQGWDIFCRIVDNYGDIGVCWRLSKQLAHEHKIQIRLIIDDLNVASKIIPNLNYTLKSQVINGVEILDLQSANTIQPAEVALETFSCGLPAEYLAKMQNTLWVNLEYLSAEPWVADFHAQSSNNTKPTRHFFFPGFTEATGGLIREKNIITENQAITNHALEQTAFLESLNVQNNDALKVSLFCYPHAPIHGLLTVLSESNQAVDCFVPATSILPDIAAFFSLNASQTTVGSKLTLKNLNLYLLPFLSQEDYDKLLSICDVNFVRGEDSWIRAIWASKPFIWQPYLQTEDTHITKLEAFLDLFYDDCESSTEQSIRQLNLAWVNGNLTTKIWQNYLDQLASTKRFTYQRARQLAAQTDLASKLVIFLQKLRVKV